MAVSGGTPGLGVLMPMAAPGSRHGGPLRAVTEVFPPNHYFYFLYYFHLQHPNTHTHTHKTTFIIVYLSTLSTLVCTCISKTSYQCPLVPSRTPKFLQTCISFTPVYSLQLNVYPVTLSASTKAFMPHLVGFFGIYCTHHSRPLKLTMDSSTAISHLRV